MTKPTNTPVIESMEECNTFIARLGNAQRERARIATRMNDELAAIKRAYEEQAKPHTEEIARLIEAIKQFCNGHRDGLTLGGKRKHYEFGMGRVAWRRRPPKVNLRAKKKILDALKQLGLSQFIRLTEDIDKEAMLRNPELATKVPGVGIGSEGEDFVVKPFETELEEAA